MSQPAEHYYRRYVQRTRQLREKAGFSAAELARHLGIEAATYRQYEYRSPLPHHLIANFARFVQCDIEQLITGHRRHTQRYSTAAKSYKVSGS